MSRRAEGLVAEFGELGFYEDLANSRKNHAGGTGTSLED